ncbi:MAG: RluA family pseudouridine synthase [Candidatus Tectomicrobia bacterium]|uniref:Pseudouridine synthase n=1 Tax=Tectimicrobiota bacterium TaxID=2528274 RepID=A0A932MMB0_UNCTE|nr:RluA family pseudouridine synthase [Candidatus Tectomicrobia bacterium]
MCAEGAARLDVFLASRLPDLSRSRLQALIKEGRVRVNGRPPAKAGQPVPAGASIEVEVPPPEPSYLLPEAIALDVRYEDAHLLVVNKPPGLVVHPGAGQKTGTLAAALLHHCRGQLSGIGGVERPGIVHRLDKDTSGLLLAAKTDRAHRRLSADMKARRVRREYLAIVRGVPARAQDAVDAPIGRHSTRRTEMAVIERGRPAVTRFKVRERFKGAALLEVTLETGRTHQVRVHLAHIGHPVLGDPVYGRSRVAKKGEELPPDLIARQALHAFRLRFTHPETGEEKVIEAAPPEDFMRAVERLRGQGFDPDDFKI